MAERSGSLFGNSYVGGEYDPDPAINVAANHPTALTVGEPFELEIVITDTRGEPRVVETIDFNGAVCDVFTYGAPAPAPMNQNINYGYREYHYSDGLDANADYTFNVSLTPKFAGTHEGSITVYMENYVFHQIPLTFDVRAAGDTQPRSEDTP